LLQQLRIHVERNHRGSPDSRPTDQPFPVTAPTEVFIPSVRARIEEWSLFIGARVYGNSSAAFRNITVGAGEAEVLGDGLTASGTRSDMVEMECLPDENLWRVAILTSSCRLRFDLTRHLGGDVRGHRRVFPRFGAGSPWAAR